MARTQIVRYTYTCDVCGSAIDDGDTDTASRTISWEGTDLVLDVCSVHGVELTGLLGQLRSFADVGSPARGRRGRRPQSSAGASSRGRRPAGSSAARSPKRADMSAVREWARDNGFAVSTRGRIPATVLAAYAASASTPAASNNGALGAAAEPAPAPAKASPRKRAPRKAKAAGAEV